LGPIGGAVQSLLLLDEKKKYRYPPCNKVPLPYEFGGTRQNPERNRIRNEECGIAIRNKDFFKEKMIVISVADPGSGAF
jgi:hypothetical protein